MPIEDRAFTRLVRRVDLLERLRSRKGHSHPLFDQVFLDGDDVVVESPDGSEIGRFTADGLTSGPLGVLGYAEVTSNEDLGSSDAFLTGLEVTVDVAANRRIKVTGHGITLDVGGSGRRAIEVTEGPALGRVTDATGSRAGFDGSVIVTPSAGSHTYKLRYNVISGTNHRLEAASTAPAFILAEDIGKA